MKGTLINIPEQFIWMVYYYEDNEIKYEIIDREDDFKEGEEVEFEMIGVQKLDRIVDRAQLIKVYE